MSIPLRKPYTHALPIKQVRQLYRALTDFRNQVEAIQPRRFQFVLVEQKPVSYGVRLSLSMLSFAPGFMPQAEEGCTPDQWIAHTDQLKGVVRGLLPHGVNFRTDHWTNERKFWCSIKLYIQYAELS